jgi:hypothetical protein
MTFHDLHGVLINYVNQCVQRGEISERGLALRTGISQPHVHNTLKGKRLFSWDNADAILRELKLDLLELIRLSEIAK